MKQGKRLAALLLTAFMVLSLFAGCGADGRDKTGPAEASLPADGAETAAADDPDPAGADEQEAAEATPDGGSFRVTAYIRVESLEDPQSFDASHLADVTDVILFGDAAFDSTGKVSAGSEFTAAAETLRELTKGLAVRVHAALIGPKAADGGGGWAQEMESMAREHQKAFDSGVLEENILAFLRQYELDGVSFDYEFPVSDSAKERFGDFLVSLRDLLGGAYAIGMAVSAGYADYPETAIGAVDAVELMSYDVWDDDGMHATLQNAKDDVRKLLGLGYPAEKIDLGIPFYARPTTHEKVWHAYRDFYDRIDRDGLYYESRTGLTHSFNTRKVVYDKTAWAIGQGLGGVMVWHYACDVPAENEYSLFKAIVRAKEEN